MQESSDSLVQSLADSIVALTIQLDQSGLENDSLRIALESRPLTDNPIWIIGALIFTAVVSPLIVHSAKRWMNRNDDTLRDYKGIAKNVEFDRLADFLKTGRAVAAVKNYKKISAAALGIKQAVNEVSSLEQNYSIMKPKPSVEWSVMAVESALSELYGYHYPPLMDERVSPFNDEIAASIIVIDEHKKALMYPYSSEERKAMIAQAQRMDSAAQQAAELFDLTNWDFD